MSMFIKAINAAFVHTVLKGVIGFMPRGGGAVQILCNICSLLLIGIIF